MELSKTEYQQGEIINPIMYLKNISNRTIRLFNQMANNIFLDFKIINENEETVYQLGKVLFQFVPFTKDLKPGEEIISIHNEAKVSDEGTGTHIPIQLSKATYTVVEFIPMGTLEVTYLEPWEPVGEITLETPPITITIT
jgi:hypothetical protein